MWLTDGSFISNYFQLGPWLAISLSYHYESILWLQRLCRGYLRLKCRGGKLVTADASFIETATFITTCL